MWSSFHNNNITLINDSITCMYFMLKTKLTSAVCRQNTVLPRVLSDKTLAVSLDCGKSFQLHLAQGRGWHQRVSAAHSRTGKAHQVE